MMGIYVGPYIYCTVDRVTPTIEIRSCSSEICHLLKERKQFLQNQNFCTACGSLVANVMVTGQEQDSVSWFALNEATRERLCQFNADYNPPGAHIHIPNTDLIRRFSSSVDSRELRVRAVMIEQEMEWLRIAFKKEIDLALELYGEDRVELRWGILGRY